ncbi:FAD-dependent thymidylate synthase [Synechocystis sp. PCC 7339]|nr:FAD-dependent thymidylate synthase [Synechocystis sp. PCC 7338]UAJ74307.1 FAD-dependent thymidylate synthase [Synechocystis sp. PCC 7339]
MITTIQPNGIPNYIPIQKLYERQHWGQYQKLRVRVYDETTKQFTTAPIREVFYTGVKPIYEVLLEDGKSIKTTKEHKFLTRQGFLSLEEALGLEMRGNTVTLTSPQDLAVNGMPCHQNREWLATAKARSIQNQTGLQGIADEAGVTIHTIRKWLKKLNLCFTKQEISLLFEPWNKGKTGYKIKPRTLEQKEYMKSITPRGEDHHAWKGGGSAERKAIANYFNSYRQVIFKAFDYKCQMCGKPLSEFDRKVDLHHIKLVSEYPEHAYDLENIIPVHRKCHMEYHGKTYDYKASREKHRGNTLVPRFKSVVSVKYLGEMPTYDLEVDHHSHNYVANKIIVHNSQRYAKATTFETYEARRQDVKNRQNSLDDFDENTKQWFNQAQADVWEKSYQLYEEALTKGIAKECARSILPLNTVTRLYMKGSVRSWIHYFSVRCDQATQKEHREIALAARKIFVEHFPTVAAALEW